MFFTCLSGDAQRTRNQNIIENIDRQSPLNDFLDWGERSIGSHGHHDSGINFFHGDGQIDGIYITWETGQHQHGLRRIEVGEQAFPAQMHQKGRGANEHLGWQNST